MAGSLFGDKQDNNVIGKNSKRTSFMDDLFGKPSKESSSTNEFTIDEKYKKSQQTSQDKGDSTTSKWSGPLSGLGMEIGGRQGRRRGNAVINQDTSLDKKSSLNVDDLFDRVASGKDNSAFESQNMTIPSRRNESKQMEVVSSTSQLQNNLSSQQQQEPAYANTSSDAKASNETNMFTIQNEKLMHDQTRKMQDFERQQQEQFQKDMEDQRRILELKQQEYKVRNKF